MSHGTKCRPIVCQPVTRSDFNAVECIVKPMIGGNDLTVLMRRKATIQATNLYILRHHGNTQ